MKKDIRKIFIVLALYAMASGIFYNFQELWMANNNLSVKTIGIVYSLCAILTVSTIFLCSNLIKKEKIKFFALLLLLIKGIAILILYFLNSTGHNILIKFLIMVEYVVDTEVYACIYPMLSLVSKDDKTYAKKDIIYDGAYYIGVLLTGFLLGKTIININIDYNFYLYIACFLVIFAFFVLKNVDLEQYYKSDKKQDIKENSLLNSLLKKLKKDRISLTYLVMIIFNQISYYSIFGLTITLLTKGLGYTPVVASNMSIISGLCAVIIATIILSKLTFKNNYINISIKFGIRLILYIIAALLNNKVAILIALAYPKLMSDSYSHVTEAPYINRIDSEYQLAFCNLREMMKYLGTAIGTYICGLAFTSGIRYIFIIAALFCLIELLLRFNILNLKNKEEERNDR